MLRIIWCLVGSHQLQIILSGITLYYLIRYASDTKKIATGTKQQAEGLARPHLIVRPGEPNKVDRHEQQGWYVENVGSGPALNVRSPAFGQPEGFSYASISPGIPEAKPLRNFGEEATFFCKSLSNTEYEFSVRLNERGKPENLPGIQKL
jgi:hypothetical protein